MCCPSQSPWLHHQNYVWWVQSIKLLVMQSSPLPCYASQTGFRNSNFPKKTEKRFNLFLQRKLTYERACVCVCVCETRERERQRTVLHANFAASLFEVSPTPWIFLACKRSQKQGSLGYEKLLSGFLYERKVGKRIPIRTARKFKQALVCWCLQRLT
jgi:hypothetical protein